MCWSWYCDCIARRSAPVVGSRPVMVRVWLAIRQCSSIRVRWVYYRVRWYVQAWINFMWLKYVECLVCFAMTSNLLWQVVLLLFYIGWLLSSERNKKISELWISVDAQGIFVAFIFGYSYKHVTALISDFANQRMLKRQMMNKTCLTHSQTITPFDAPGK